jgi:hypothetical protein
MRLLMGVSLAFGKVYGSYYLALGFPYVLAVARVELTAIDDDELSSKRSFNSLRH